MQLSTLVISVVLFGLMAVHFTEHVVYVDR